MHYKYMGKQPHNLIIKNIKVVLRRGDMVELPERIKSRKARQRLEKTVVKKEKIE